MSLKERFLNLCTPLQKTHILLIRFGLRLRKSIVKKAGITIICNILTICFQSLIP
jgi:hypothetical protein